MGYPFQIIPANRCIFPNLLSTELDSTMSVYGVQNLRPVIPKGGSAESRPNNFTKCPNCGARYTTRIYQCDYCGLGPNKMPTVPKYPETRKIKGI